MINSGRACIKTAWDSIDWQQAAAYELVHRELIACFTYKVQAEDYMGAQTITSLTLQKHAREHLHKLSAYRMS